MENIDVFGISQKFFIFPSVDLSQKQNFDK